MRGKSFLLIFCLLYLPVEASSLGEAKKLKKEGEWRKSALLLDEILSKNPKDFQSLLLRGEIAILERDLVVAEEILHQAKKINPSSAELYYCLSQASLGREKYEESLKFLKEAEKIRPEWFRIYEERAWVYIGMRDIPKAYHQALAAQKKSDKSSSVYSLLGYIYYRMNQISNARISFYKALELDPMDRSAHWYLGTGMGFSSGNKSLQNHPEHWKKLQEGLKAMEERKFKSAIEKFSFLTKKYPQNATCHFLLSETLRRKNFSQHRLESLSSFQYLSQYSFAPALSESMLSRFFVHYDQLSSAEKKVLHYSVAPLRKYLPRLLDHGMQHYLLPMEMRISEIPFRKNLENQYTIDGRRYGDVRGLTDRTAVSGRETIDSARYYSYNTVAHELAHQVHMNLFSEEEKEKVQSLYARALRENRCLDYYAAATVYEYFAQGYEAFVSMYKRPFQGITSRHTRDELKQRDPQLYAFLKGICEPVLSRGEWILIYYHLGKVYEGLKEKEKAKASLEKATYLALGMIEED